MTYLGGTYPSVRGHPPQRAMQYCLPASTRRNRASSILRLAPQRTSTSAGRLSRITDLSSFPRLHFCQYGFVTAHSREHAPPVALFIECRNIVDCKTDSAHGMVKSPKKMFTFAAAIRSRDEQRPAHPPAVRAVGPGHPSPRVTGATPSPHGRTADSTPAASLCPHPKALRQPAQLSRRSVRLPQSRPFQPHGSGFVFNPRDLRPVAKLNEDYVGHRLVSKSARKPVRPSSVQSPCT